MVSDWHTYIHNEWQTAREGVKETSHSLGYCVHPTSLGQHWFLFPRRVTMIPRMRSIWTTATWAGVATSETTTMTCLTQSTWDFSISVIMCLVGWYFTHARHFEQNLQRSLVPILTTRIFWGSVLISCPDMLTFKFFVDFCLFRFHHCRSSGATHPCREERAAAEPAAQLEGRPRPHQRWSGNKKFDCLYYIILLCL